MLIALYGLEFIFGEEAFMTREEAEKALKEELKKNESCEARQYCSWFEEDGENE